jgi:HAE1 family hydrophobic/amphiphilic exporter-1
LERIPQQLYPTVTFPQLTIVTPYVNAAPEEIETLITKPIEEAVGSVAGLKSMSSVSREGMSIVTVSFTWGTDIDFAALALREK